MSFVGIKPKELEVSVAATFLLLAFFSPGDTHIRCFSHTHMVGSGVWDYGNIGVMAVRPSRGERLTLETVRNYGYRSRFTHLTETVEPGE